MKQKGLAPILIVLIIATIVGLVVYQQQSKSTSTTKINDIANWKTYTNEEYKFAVKYPSHWTYKETVSTVNLNDEGHPAKTVFFGEPFLQVIDGKEIDLTTGIVHLYITTKTPQYNIDRILNKRYFKSPEDSKKFSIGPEILVDGIKAKQIIDNDCYIWWCRTVLWEQNNYTYDMMLNQETRRQEPNQSTTPKDLQTETFTQMLASFKYSL